MQVVSNALRVIECVIQQQPIGVTEIAHHLGLPKTSVHRTLRTLEDSGWLGRQRGDSRKWVQTPRLWVLAHQGPGVEVRDLSLPAQEMIHELTDENVHLTQTEGDNMMVIDKIESTQPIRVFDPIGTRVPLHLSSSGKAMLSTWSLEDLEAYIRRVETSSPSDADDAGRKFNAADLREELEEIRERGYALNHGCWRSEISGVGTPLPLADLDGPASYGLAISIPTHRFTEEKIPELGRLLLEARKRVLGAAGLL